MLRQRHRLSGHEFEQTPADSGGEGGLVWGSPWGHKESDTTWLLNNNNVNKATFHVSDLQIFLSERDVLIWGF